MLSCQKSLFKITDEITYLNCAYMSPQLKQVDMIGREMVSRKNQPWLIQPEDFFTTVEELKTLFAKLINTPEKDRIAVIPSASYGLATVARNIKIKPGQHILVAEEQFPSNYYVWQRVVEDSGAELRVVKAPNSNNRSAAWNEAILNAIDDNTVLVALGNVHWADGTLYDLKRIRERTDEFGALLVIDGTQSVGALPLDVSEVRLDALVCGGYKWLLGPYSLGVAYYGPRFDEGIPLEENWINRYNSEDFKGLVNYQDEYKPQAGRYMMGEQSNFILAPMLSAAIAQLLDWGVANVQEYCQRISSNALEDLREMGCQIEPKGQSAHHLIGVRLPAQVEMERLQAEFKKRRVLVSTRGNAIRVAPNVYNMPDDFDNLLDCFKAVWV
jgi:selenocysteine lyase/cysteine desulfurase